MNKIKCSSDNSLLVSPSLKLIAAAAISCAALGASADQYILGGESNQEHIGSDSQPVSWSDTSNWTPSEVPGENDSVNWAPTKTSSHRFAHVKIDGNYSIGYMTTKWRSFDLFKAGSAEGYVVFTVKYGLGNSGYQHHVVNAGVKLVVPETASFTWGLSDGVRSDLTLKSGSAAEILASTVESQMTEYIVNSDSVLMFNPTAYVLSKQSSDVNRFDKFTITGGAVVFDCGINATADTESKNQGNTQIISHNDGSVTFGGDFSSELPWEYDWSAGTLNISNDCAFGNNVSLVIPASSVVTLNVASGKTFTAPGLSADSSAAITKSGDGLFVIPPTTAQISVTAGGIGFASASSYDLSNVSFAGGTKIAITTFNATIAASHDSLDNATFTADLDGAVAGTVIINSSSSNTAILTKAKEDIENANSVPAGFALVVSDTMLSLEKDAGAANTISISGDLLADASWGGGSVPDAGSEVAIAGEGVVASYSGGDVPAWALIEVKDGATLRIGSAASGLPQIKLNKNATLEIADGASLTLSSSSDLVGVATASKVPVLSVVSGATLNVPGGMKFSNVNISLAGTIATTTSGGVTFGYAGNGETTYIGFAANGGTIAITEGSGSTYDLDPIEFCCPQSGSSVVAVGDLVLNEANLPKTSGYDYMTGRMVGFHLGRNNSEDMSFNVVFNNTKWGTSGKLYICGGATFSLTNNSSFITYEHHTQWDRHVEISGKGRLYLGEGAEFRLNSLGNYGDRTLVVNPSVSGYNAIVVEHGAIFENYRWTGNNNGVFSVSNGVYRIFEPYIIENEELKSVNTPFDGLQAVNLSDDSVLTFTTRNQANGHGYFNNGDDRVVSFANVPITGAGSIALDNANVNKFGVIVTCGSNTAAGSASVVAPGEGEGETTLYFADGANWAGRVVTGNVALTNLVDSAAACTNTFGTLDLAAGTELKIRVWKTGGVIVAHDGLNVGSYKNHGGKIVLVAMGEELKPGDSFILGTIGDDSTPAFAGRWEARKENGSLKVKYSSGMTVIMR